MEQLGSFFSSFCKYGNEEALEPYNRVLDYLKHGNEGILEPYERAIVGVFNNQKQIDDLKDLDSRKLLNIVKIVDIALADYNRMEPIKKEFVVSSYHIRNKILEFDPIFSTNEVYTKTVDYKKLSNKNYLRNPNNWIAERVGHQAKIFINQYIKARALSERLSTFKSHCCMIRGPTGSGKSQYIDTEFKKFSDENGNLSGILNPDEFKFGIKQIEQRRKPQSELTLVNIQVHLEGAALSENLKIAILNQPLNVILEGRFSKIEEVEEIIRPCRQKLHKIFLVDIAHQSLSTLLRRVLSRDPFGKDPCPLVKDVVKGYIESIMYREKLLGMVKGHPSINFFKLYFVDEQGDSYLIAQKENYRYKILSKKLLKESCTLPSSLEIERQIYEVIDKNLFPQIGQWIGMKIGHAIDRNACINFVKRSAFVEESRWGEAHPEPFDGRWLSEYPFLIEHLESEHILHIRESDSWGIGLHWSTNKFPEGPNAKFSQDARVGNAPRKGFQMKLGYFLVPVALLDQHLANHSPAVYENLINEKSHFRFFVHPEAYDNFGKLHSCKDVVFVKPEDSEFMGTPTSSYRSWLIRRISGSERGMPFIVKMGVGSQRNRGKFLPKEDILKSIRAQENINKIQSNEVFFCFPETIGITLKEGLFEEDSGLIIREIPQGLLSGQHRILSFSALMSFERHKKENHGLCAILPKYHDLEKLPLIYEIIQNTILKRCADGPLDFIDKYLIEKYFQATKELFFENGYSFSPHGQNLCVVLDKEGIPLGFAYRDLEGISEGGKGYIESYSWFYRYHCIVKLLNVFTFGMSEYFDPPHGAPTQLGFSAPLKERNLYPLLNGLSYHKIYFSYRDYKSVLENLDGMFLNYLSRYFNIQDMHELKVGTIPSAEGGASGEANLALLNNRLWTNRLSTLKQL